MPRKTSKCVATVSGRIPFAFSAFEFAQREDGAWFYRETHHGLQFSSTIAWRPAANPLATLALEDAGDDHVHVGGKRAYAASAPGEDVRMPLPGWADTVIVADLFVTGDIGHRYRLPSDGVVARG